MGVFGFMFVISIMDTALHSSLNFSGSNMPSTINGKCVRTKLYPQTSSFNAGSDIRIKLPANELASYADFAGRAYLQLTISPATGNLTLNREGILGVFQSLLIQTPSQTICDINDFSNLVATLKDLQSDSLHKANIGALTTGESPSNIGVTLAAGGSFTFSIPIPVNPLSTSNNYIPLFSREEIELVLTLGSVNLLE